MATSNRIRALNRLPFDFQDGLKVGGVDVTALNQTFTPAGAGLVGFTPVGNLAAGNVQAALAELESEKVGFARLDDTDGSSLVGYDGGTVQDVLDTMTGPTGAASVGYTPAGTGAVATDVQAKLRESVSVLDFVPINERAAIFDGTSTYDAAPAIEEAWAECQDGGELVILGKPVVKRTVVLSDKPVNIDCRGEIQVADGTFLGIHFAGTPDLTQPGTALTALTEGMTTLSYATAPAIKAEEYYVVFNSTEDLVTRVGSDSYTPYKKLEPHDFTSHLFTLSDSILYTYSDLSLLTINYKRKARRTVIKNLKVTAQASASTSSRDLVQLTYRSGITFENLLIDGKAANRIGNGIHLAYCNDLIFNAPVVTGYNRSGGVSYKLLNTGSVNIVFNDYNPPAEDDPSGSKEARGYVARHGNRVTFNRGASAGLDDHYGSNYTLIDYTFTGSGFGFAGKNLTFKRCKSFGYSMFVLRPDTPVTHGTLLMEDCEISPTSALIHAVADTTVDPLARTTPFKVFDHIKLVRPTVTPGIQSRASYPAFINIDATTNITTFVPVSGKTILIDGYDNQSTVASVGYSAVRIGRITYDSLTVRNSKKADGGIKAYGDIRWLSEVVIPDVTIENSYNIIPYNIIGATTLNIINSKIGGLSDGFLVYGNSTPVTVTFDGCRITQYLSVLNGTADSSPKIRFINNSFSFLTPGTDVYVVEAHGNTVDAGVTVSAAWRGKLWNYSNAAVTQAGVLVGSATYDPPSLADGTGVTTTVTVTGAALGDAVTAASFSLDLQGVMLTAWVSAANTVSVRLQNETGGTIDLASGTIRVRVMKLG